MTRVGQVSSNQIKLLLSAPFYHLSSFHLAINLLSFYVKSRKLENKLGVLRYLMSVALSVVGTSVAYIVIGSLWKSRASNSLCSWIVWSSFCPQGDHSQEL